MLWRWKVDEDKVVKSYFISALLDLKEEGATLHQHLVNNTCMI